MKLLFLGASNTDCDHCFSGDNLGYGYVKMVSDLLQKNHSSECGNISAGPFTVINGGTDGFTFPRIYQKWKMMWQGIAFDAVFLLGGINEVGALMDSGMDGSAHQELLQRSADALTDLLLGLYGSGCREIFVLEPFLFDTPQYLKSWMETLEEVRDMIRRTVQSAGRIPSGDFRPRTTQNTAYHIHLLATQPILDNAIQSFGLSEVTKDGIHLAQKGHLTLAKMIVDLIGFPEIP